MNGNKIFCLSEIILSACHGSFHINMTFVSSEVQ